MGRLTDVGRGLAPKAVSSTEIGFIVVNSTDPSIAICDRDVRSLVGWAVVPDGVPFLDEFRSFDPSEPSH